MVAFISGGCNAARVVANSPGWLHTQPCFLQYAGGSTAVPKACRTLKRSQNENHKSVCVGLLRNEPKSVGCCEFEYILVDLR